MKPGPDLRARLRSAADELPVGPPPLDSIARRGRRRLVRKVVSYGVALALVLGGVGVGLSSLRGLGNTNLQLPDGTTIPKPAITATIALPGVADVITIANGSAWV